MTRGLTAHPATARALHGEMVAFGTLVQMAHERRSDDELRDVAAFCRSCGLPATLAALGLDDATEDALSRMIEPTLAAPYVPHLLYP